MTEESKTQRPKIENLEEPPQELTPEEQETASGGDIFSQVITATGSILYENDKRLRDVTGNLR
jgi:hypothetical protein